MAAAKTPPFSKKKILIVTSDLPSHPYACVKLAKVLAESGHIVTLASPEGPAHDRIVNEISPWATSDRTIAITTIGKVSTKVHANVRPVIDAQSYSALFNGIRNPLPLAEKVETMFDEQEELYSNLKSMIHSYDLLFAIHSVAATVCDAIESLSSTTGETVPCIIFSSLPYDSSFYLSGRDQYAWMLPRTIVSLPHVATYSSPKKLFDNTSLPKKYLSYFLQLFWMALDAYLVNRAWAKAGTRANIRRARRGLPPVKDYRTYLQEYPVLTFGGVRPYVAEGEKIADNVTCVGAIDTHRSDLDRMMEINSAGKSFSSWFNAKNCCNKKIIFASFGTGTQLNDDEISNVAKLALSERLRSKHCILLALRSEEQQRLRRVLDKALNSKPTEFGEGYLEYFDGNFRIDSNIPQTAVLESGRVAVFISHMGFGGFSEGVRAGVPFVVHPSGCDQYFNASRAVEAGIALRPGKNMEGLENAACDVLNDTKIKDTSRILAKEATNGEANDIVIDMVDRLFFVSDLSKRFEFSYSLSCKPGHKNEEVHSLACHGGVGSRSAVYINTQSSVALAKAA